MTSDSWDEILSTRYGHRRVTLERELRSYSVHYIYQLADKRRYVLSKVRKDENRIPFGFQFELLQRLSCRLDEVNEVVKPKGGTTSWVDTDDHHWFVRRCLEDAVPAGGQDGDLVVPAARLLANIHEAAGDLWVKDRPLALC